MYPLLKSILFLLPPERAHHLTVALLKTGLRIPLLGGMLRRSWRLRSDGLVREVAGLQFPNPVGLAAGFDKDGKYFREMAALGFGFLELGTVTPRPQSGNPQPRLFRLPADRALINRMGFNNEGVDALVGRLRQGRPKGVVLGGNIGKNKTTPNEEAVKDYEICFEKLFPYVDYFVVNVSSPNTPNLRELQEREPLTALLNRLQDLNRQREAPKPLFLKIAPDLNEGQLQDIVTITREVGIAGLIATNTTIDRSGLQTSEEQVESIGAGGLSGAPVRSRSTEVIRFLRAHLPPEVAIIGVGGIASPADAREKLEAGADLVQIYTGLVYEGPALVKHINRGLALR